MQLEEELKGRVELWEQEQEQAFLVNGQRFMEYVAEQWQLHHMEKEKEKQERVSEQAESPQAASISASLNKDPFVLLALV